MATFYGSCQLDYTFPESLPPRPCPWTTDLDSYIHCTVDARYMEHVWTWQHCSIYPTFLVSMGGRGLVTNSVGDNKDLLFLLR